MKEKILGIVLGITSLTLIVMVAQTNTRSDLKKILKPNSRKVLSIVRGDLMGNGSQVKAVKYQTAKGISVDILSIEENGASSLIDQIHIHDERDGFFEFFGEASRLAILDVNGDGILELVAPTFDASMIGHLNAFQFNATLNRFEAIQKR